MSFFSPNKPGFNLSRVTVRENALTGENKSLIDTSDYSCFGRLTVYHVCTPFFSSLSLTDVSLWQQL